MKYIISESKLEAVAFKFLDEYLKDYPLINKPNVVLYGEGDQNVIAYDKEDKILFVSQGLYELVRNMFSITNTPAKKIFSDYMASKGYKVLRFV